MAKIDLSRALWVKSSRSGGGQDCVEVARVPGIIAVRDSKNPGGGALTFTPELWRAFSAGVKRGGFEL